MDSKLSKKAFAARLLAGILVLLAVSAFAFFMSGFGFGFDELRLALFWSSLAGVVVITTAYHDPYPNLVITGTVCASVCVGGAVYAVKYFRPGPEGAHVLAILLGIVIAAIGAYLIPQIPFIKGSWRIRV